MYKLNIVISAIKKMTIKELRDFIYENYYSRIRLTKENRYYPIKTSEKKKIYYNLLSLTKLIEKIPYPSKTKEYYQSYLKNPPSQKKKIGKTIKSNY